MSMTEGQQPSTAQMATDQAQQVASTAADKGKEVAGTAAEQAQQVVGTARDQAAQVASEASAQVSKVVNDAKGHLHEQARTQTEQVGNVLDRLAGQLRAVSEGRADEGGPVADVVRQAAQRVEKVTERVYEGGFDGVVSDVQRFARRRPGMFLAGAVTAGVAVGRLMRAGRDSGALKASGGSPTGPDQTSSPQLPAAGATWEQPGSWTPPSAQAGQWASPPAQTGQWAPPVQPGEWASPPAQTGQWAAPPVQPGEWAQPPVAEPPLPEAYTGGAGTVPGGAPPAHDPYAGGYGQEVAQ